MKFALSINSFFEWFLCSRRCCFKAFYTHQSLFQYRSQSSQTLLLLHQVLWHSKFFEDFFFLFILSYFFVNFILFNFTILYWFCYIWKWICHRYTCVPHPEPSSLLLPHTITLGRPVHQPQASSIEHRTWTGDSFHIWYCTYFNAILPNHPTVSLSHRIQKTVLYMSVSFAVSYTGLLLPSF